MRCWWCSCFRCHFPLFSSPRYFFPFRFQFPFHVPDQLRDCCCFSRRLMAEGCVVPFLSPRRQIYSGKTSAGPRFVALSAALRTCLSHAHAHRFGFHPSSYPGPRRAPGPCIAHLQTPPHRVPCCTAQTTDRPRTPWAALHAASAERTPPAPLDCCPAQPAPPTARPPPVRLPVPPPCSPSCCASLPLPGKPSCILPPPVAGTTPSARCSPARTP
mmetsp:Transcript_26346/g.66461  ORF Transcript_26346/g.66461 Transcript_26346/m.66461 type:complete len:215 (-) Transcript_26346:977-1621(-)